MEPLPKVLIVDDTPDHLEYLDTILKKLSVKTISAESGFEAIEKIQGKDLALAIIDVRMSGMNGYELATKINE
jgi:CheY-like chemotaxis protein